MNVRCLFHKNWHMAPCLLCTNINVVKSDSLLEFSLFQIFLKSLTGFSFSSQGCVLNVFCFPCQFSAFNNFCFRTIVVSFPLAPTWHMLLFKFVIAVWALPLSQHTLLLPKTQTLMPRLKLHGVLPNLLTLDPCITGVLLSSSLLNYSQSFIPQEWPKLPD